MGLRELQSNGLAIEGIFLVMLNLFWEFSNRAEEDEAAAADSFAVSIVSMAVMCFSFV